MRLRFTLLLVAACLQSRGQSIELAKADSIAEKYPGHSLSDLGLLSERLTGPLKGDMAKFRVIYKWVCLNIESDYDMMELNRRKIKSLSGDKLQNWYKRFSLSTFNKLINERKTLCTGYAWLVRELSLRAGIKCEMIYGYGKTTRSNIGGTSFLNHTWNAVWLDSQWFLCDPTWSAGSISSEDRKFNFKYIDSYFLADPTFFILNHYPLHAQWTLIDNAPSLQAFLSAPLIYPAAYDYRTIPFFPQTFKVEASKGRSLDFSISTPQGFSGPLTLIIKTPYSTEGVKALQTGSTITHTFSKKGIYAVHFTVCEKYVASYEVTIR
jgi:Transglutaminase-like superfamily